MSCPTRKRTLRDAGLGPRPETGGELSVCASRFLVHSVQPSFLSNTSHAPTLVGGFLERRIPGKNGDVTLGCNMAKKGGLGVHEI